MSIVINGGVVIGGNVSGVTIINGRVVGGNSFGMETLRGNGEVAQQHRDLSDSFHGVDASGIQELEIVCGKPNQGVELKGESNLLPAIETRVEDGILHIEPKSGTAIESRQPISATLFVENLDQLEISGQVRGHVEGLDASRLLVDMSGQTSLEVEGKAQRVGVEVSGQSWFTAENLQADSVSIDASGQSRANIGSAAKLDVDASGMSEVTYRGTPALSKDVSGMSRVYSAGGPAPRREPSSSNTIVINQVIDVVGPGQTVVGLQLDSL